ncbi:hypothetical protein GX50_03648 [[Emmonsia] crescens]|uniref:Uncharacterized protein n=1 Tax=[Emmonsia] crescens TaxID=73230 RepID=A0A2B7Z4M4_9EURO|nr:hypothetical protein GX50_08941 [Emmonsia crescens]PGH33492.1 hypothetical protein GX50_03648 [Emmonsia crescens]
MALKRKASFTTITSPGSYSTYHNHNQTSPIPIPFLGTTTITVDEPPRHLHSRTRKRFRNDRPDEQSIYDKTLQWLFSAQRKPQSQSQSQSQNNLAMFCSESTPVASAEGEENAAAAVEQPSLDSNQQTLQRFFQPVRASRNHTQSHHMHNPGFKKAMMHPAAQPLLNNGISISHSVSAEGTGVNMGMGMDMGMDIDIDIDMDVGVGCAGIAGFVPVHMSMALSQGQKQGQEYEQDKRWVGGIGWM